MFVYEPDIENPNYNRNRNKEAKMSKTDSYSFIEKLRENACKILNNKNKINNKTENNKESSNKKVISSPKITNNLTNNLNKNKNIQRKNSQRKSTQKIRKKGLQINSNEQFLYDLNLRDNTSNSLNQFVVLTTKKYIDFFK